MVKRRRQAEWKYRLYMLAKLITLEGVTVTMILQVVVLVCLYAMTSNAQKISNPQCKFSTGYEFGSIVR